MTRTNIWLYFAAALALLFLLLLLGNQADLDLWGKLALGAVRQQTGLVPQHDPFSYTASHAPWVDHEWGAGAIFYHTLIALGSPGLFGSQSHDGRQLRG